MRLPLHLLAIAARVLANNDSQDSTRAVTVLPSSSDTVEAVRITEPLDCRHMFVPSMDWKAIKPDECLPAGLSIRINFETGVKEARLKAADDDTVSDNRPSQLNIQREGDAGGSGIVLMKDSERYSADKAHAYLLPVAGASDDEIQKHLDWLEQEISDIDEGVTLMESHAAKTALVSLFSHSSPNPRPPVLRAHAARVFAQAVSNNPQAQATALDAMDRLLDALAAEADANARKSLLHATACLVRGNQAAARVFSRHAGFERLKGVHAGAKADRRLQHKVVDLVVDLFDADLMAVDFGGTNLHVGGEHAKKDELHADLMARFKVSGFCDGTVSDYDIQHLCASK
ncbi:hypothetical protein BC830DRAFT_1232710 [Chytriomyces sp. MP71]|nr:hypothetical protein BC830DRAFT_1232710 [Chytriomyces sp. MP71]